MAIYSRSRCSLPLSGEPYKVMLAKIIVVVASITMCHCAAAQQEDVPIETGVCKILQNPSQYSGKRVRVRAESLPDPNRFDHVLMIQSPRSAEEVGAVCGFLSAKVTHSSELLAITTFGTFTGRITTLGDNQRALAHSKHVSPPVLLVVENYSDLYQKRSMNGPVQRLIFYDRTTNGLVAQPVGPAASPVASLEFRIVAEKLVRGLPEIFTFVFVNRSDHELRMPRPTQCSGGSGTIILRSQFKPLNERGVPSGGGGGCGAGHSAGPPVLEWAKSWETLKPGESLSVKYSRRDLFNFQEDPGMYDIWAEYVPPELSVKDIAQLESAGFDFPRLSMTSNRLHFIRPR